MIHILLTLFVLANSCKRCIDKNTVYDCGVGNIIKFGEKYQMAVCCEGVWNKCPQTRWVHCLGHCPIGFKTNNTPTILNTFATDNNHSYSECDYHKNSKRYFTRCQISA